MSNKLGVAFIWHMHQPMYKNSLTGKYLMPWVRLHAIKDYLDMLVILEKFPKIKQTFNIAPSLIDQLYDYGNNNAHDIYSRLTVSDINDLSNEDKTFILDHFFDANYINMIAPFDEYKKLYEKRYRSEQADIRDFSVREYSDIMAWFNIVWFDPEWRESIPKLNELYRKGKDYTLEDRETLIDIQRDVIRKIVPKYQELLDNGQIEISISPYYHPIMPLIIDSESARIAISDVQLPKNNFKYSEDIKTQLLKSINKFEDIFGRKPNGVWPSEHCVSPETIEILADMDLNWVVTDEGNLAKTLGKEFIRDFYGTLQDPYDLCKTYEININNKKINVLFRNSVMADLIGFEYGNLDPAVAANDLYERIKIMQTKLQAIPDDDHIVTIALDGENCWESYKEDGRPFLQNLYTLLSNDESLDVTTVSEFMSKHNTTKVLNNIHSGSWINRDFSLWIGDPTKNIAWDYLHKTRQDLINFIENGQYSQITIDKAWDEIYIAQGSDWFWWYGEPNDSGQDDMFDYIFRIHLENVYKILEKPVPDYLNIPVDLFAGKLSKTPEGILTPNINGIVDSEEEWKHAGCIEISQGPMYHPDKLLRRAHFGCDRDNIYFRFDINKSNFIKSRSEICIYFYIQDKLDTLSPVRLRSNSDTVFYTQRFLYAYEFEIPFSEGNVHDPVMSEAIESSLWKVKNIQDIDYKYKTVLELALPFANLNLEPDQQINFVIAVSKAHILQEIIPQNKVLSIIRPS